MPMIPTLRAFKVGFVLALTYPKRMLNDELTLIGYWWICLSFLSASCLWIGFYVPHWIVGSISLNGRRHTAYFSAIRRCNYPIYDEHFRMSDVCGIYTSFNDIPSIFWQLATLFIGLGCFLAIVLMLILIPSCCIQNIVTKNSSILIGLFQVVSALGVTLGCILFAVGWDNNEVRDACGPLVGKFLLGECHLGWAYVCMLFGAAMLLVCGLLSACSARSVSDYSSNRSSVQLRRDDQSFDAETLINNNLRVASNSLPAHKWHKYNARSPFVPRHSELV